MKDRRPKRIPLKCIPTHGKPLQWVGFAVFTAVALASCGKPAVEMVPAVVWTVAGNLDMGPALSRSRLAGSACFQWQESLNPQQERVVVRRSRCPEDRTQLIPDSEVVLQLEVLRSESSIGIQKNGVVVGIAVAESPSELLPADTRPAAERLRSYKMQHLCQFSEPLSEALPDRKPYFYSLCEVLFEESGPFKGIRVFSVQEILSAQTEEREALINLSVRLEQERKELLDKVKRLQDSITHLQYQADTDDFLTETEQRVDALRTELRLNADATPEAIGAAVQKQGVLISQFAREISELKKTLDLPKTAGFDEVLKALRSVKKTPDEDPNSSSAVPIERKEPAKSPIND
jgi:hypothetical protein